MITVAEIKKKAERIYPEVLRAFLTGEELFPKIIRADKSLSKDFSKMSQEIAAIMVESKDRKGFGYVMQSETINTKLHGNQDIPKAFIFENLTDFLKFIGKKSEFERFTEQTLSILLQFPQLKDCLTSKPELVIGNFGHWEDLLKVCTWFSNSLETNKYYTRELPISVHTKFIEENRSVLRILLDELIPDKLNVEEKEFEKRFFLKYPQPTIRIRYLDLRIQSGISYSDISIPMEQFQGTPLNCQRIIIIENLMNFLAFPQVEDAIAIWGKGFAIENLKQVHWLKNKNIYYWSDLDVQGFQMLSQLKSYFPQTQSFLMDSEILHAYKDFWVKGTQSNINDLSSLNDDEFATFHFLKANNLRLEQERILQSEVNKAIKLILNKTGS